MNPPQLRIGQGVDIHAWGSEKPLILAGVTIPHSQGLIAHSDGDALLHAITDALCGALGLGDIGEFFPDDSDDWKDADSSELLTKVITIVHEKGWGVVNVDSTVICEAPKLKDFKPEMQRSIAALLSISPTEVGVKATTCEKLGFIGRQEGLMASVVVLLQKDG